MKAYSSVWLTRDNSPLVVYAINYSSFTLFDTLVVYAIIVLLSFVLFDTLVMYAIIALFDTTDLILYTNSFHLHLP